MNPCLLFVQDIERETDQTHHFPLRVISFPLRCCSHPATADGGFLRVVQHPDDAAEVGRGERRPGRTRGPPHNGCTEGRDPGALEESVRAGE